MRVSEPAELDPGAIERIAFDAEPLELAPDLLTRVDEARRSMLAALDGRRVYGVTTGTGYLGSADLTAADGARHEMRLLTGRAVGGPPWLPRTEARALLAARLVNLLSGRAGASSALCVFLADRLNDDFTPAVPRSGGGCAGEIIPLSHAMQTLVGHGYVLASAGAHGAPGAVGAQGGVDAVVPAATALADRGAAPFTAGPKEGIALLAGAPGAAALGLARLRDVDALSRQLVRSTAAAIDAMRAPVDAYDPRVAELADDPVLATVLAAVRDELGVATHPRQTHQAPVSFRVSPQVLAHLRRTRDRFAEDVERGLRAVTDSPAFVDGVFLSTGAFHAVDLAAGMDGLTAAVVRAGELAAQRMHRLLDRRFSGLPDQLAVSSAAVGGVVVHKRAVGAVHELRRRAQPVSVGLADTSLGQEDAESFAFAAAENLRQAIHLVREILACELLLARRAWAVIGEPDTAGLRHIARQVDAAIVRVTAQGVAPGDDPRSDDGDRGDDVDRADDPRGDDVDRLLGILVEEAADRGPAFAST